MQATCQKEFHNSIHKNTDQINGSPIESPYIVITEKEYLGLKCDVGYWRSMHEKSGLRVEALKKTIEEQKGKIRDLRNRLFGKKSEKKVTAKKEEGAEGKKDPKPTKRKRGQQPGSKGHGRTKHQNLPCVKEPVDFPEPPTCPKCGLVYTPDESKESEIIEVEVKAYKRIIVRSCMKKGCSCKGVPSTVTAPMPPKVIPKSQYGISIWENVLLTKYLYSQPTNRLLNQYKEMGLPISGGTIAGGLQVLMVLFKPVYDALLKQQMTEERFHNDESSWKVFETIEGKTGNRWWLWLCRSASVIFYQIAPGRGADVPVDHFKNIESEKIIVVCDRYSAYKSLARQLPFIILAFCWAHVRRDFLDAAKKYPLLEDWALYWVEKIAELYHVNNLRCKAYDPKLPFWQQSPIFLKNHEELVQKMDEMAAERDAFIDTHDSENTDVTVLTNVKFKVLTSLNNHWQGLSIFVDHPEVPMDNNKGENSIRNPVTGRKNFYGSGSLWSSKLAAYMFSIFQTMILNGLNCHHWLRVYLTACAENHGKPPEDLSPFLPWTMDKDRHQQLSKPYDSS